jgi:hypothetical protein
MVFGFDLVFWFCLKAIRSVSMGPSATYESGHFYFVQTGHSHFAATNLANALTWLDWQNKMSGTCPAPNR